MDRESAVRPPSRDLFIWKYSPPFQRGEKERLIDLDHLRPTLAGLDRHSCRIAALVLLVLLNRVLMSGATSRSRKNKSYVKYPRFSLDDSGRAGGA